MYTIADGEYLSDGNVRLYDQWKQLRLYLGYRSGCSVWPLQSMCDLFTIAKFCCLSTVARTTRYAWAIQRYITKSESKPHANKYVKSLKLTVLTLSSSKTGLNERQRPKWTKRFCSCNVLTALICCRCIASFRSQDASFRVRLQLQLFAASAIQAQDWVDSSAGG